MEKFLNNRLWVGDFTRFEALAGGPFNHLNCQHTREFNQNFSKKSNARGSPRRNSAPAQPKSGYLDCTAHALLSNQNFCLLLYLFYREISCSFGIRTEETEPLKNFQIYKALNCSSY